MMQYILRTLLLLLLAGTAFPMAAQAQEDEMNRFFTEKDWVPWKKGLEDPWAVKKLFIKDKNPVNYGLLRDFKNLTGLIVYDSPMQDLTFLADHPNLTVFEIQGNSLKTLEGIQNLPKLEEFSCHSNFIRDLSPLDSLEHLRVIRLYDNELETLAPIAHLDSVIFLDVSKSKITSIAPIAGWTHLKVLSLYKCEYLTDVNAIANFRDLTDLNISFLDIPDFSLVILDSLRKLQNLRVQGMVHSDKELNHIMYHTDLEQLTMGKNDNVTTIDSLYLLKKLKYLDIHSNNISSIAILHDFYNLVKLVMYRNKVADISPLLNCTEMRSLFVHENPIEDYSPLYQMGFLQHLNIDKTAFEKNEAIQLRRALRSTKISFM